MTVYVHAGHTEAHRRPDQREDLVRALVDEGVGVSTDSPDGCDVAFCGGFQYHQEFKRALADRGFRGAVAHFNWDLYPWLVGPNRPRPVNNYTRIRDAWWREYLDDLRTCDVVLVPNAGTALRTNEYVGRGSVVVLSSCDRWEGVRWNGGHVMQSMRDYPNDPNAGLLERACRELGLTLVKPDGSMPVDEFQRAAAGAIALVSPYHEASTGGLLLLEGYRLGVPVLVADSPYQGANDYFGDRTRRFRSNDYGDLLRTLADLVCLPDVHDPVDRRRWVDENYSTAAFARRLATVFRGVTK